MAKTVSSIKNPKKYNKFGYVRHYATLEEYVSSSVDVASKLLATIIFFESNVNKQREFCFMNHTLAKWFRCSLSSITQAFEKLEKLELIKRIYNGTKRSIIFYPKKYLEYATIFNLNESKLYKTSGIHSLVRRIIKNRLYSLVYEKKRKFYEFLEFQKFYQIRRDDL